MADDAPLVRDVQRDVVAPADDGSGYPARAAVGRRRRGPAGRRRGHRPGRARDTGPVGRRLADPARFTVLGEPALGERAAREPAEPTGAQVAAVCQDLARPRTAGLVGSRREGTRICCRASGARVRARHGGGFLAAGGPRGLLISRPPRLGAIRAGRVR